MSHGTLWVCTVCQCPMGRYGSALFVNVPWDAMGLHCLSMSHLWDAKGLHCLSMSHLWDAKGLHCLSMSHGTLRVCTVCQCPIGRYGSALFVNVPWDAKGLHCLSMSHLWDAKDLHCLSMSHGTLRVCTVCQCPIYGTL